MRRFLLLIVALALLGAACNRGDDSELTTTTTTAASQRTTTTTVATTAPGGDDTTTTAGEMVPYEIIAGESSGTYVVLVEPGDYSDVDLQNIAEDVVDLYKPNLVHIIDSEDAADLVTKDQVTADEQAILDAHYLARIEGTQLLFLGPYAQFDSIQIGS